MFDFFKFLPYIMRAIDLAKVVSAATKDNKGLDGIVNIIKTHGPEVVDLVTNAGKELFPELSSDNQAAAGTLRFDPVVTKRIQGQLNRLNIADPPLEEDGAYGALTREAVRKFQTANNLEADGWAGPITQKALNAATA